MCILPQKSNPVKFLTETKESIRLQRTFQLRTGQGWHSRSSRLPLGWASPHGVSAALLRATPNKPFGREGERQFGTGEPYFNIKKGLMPAISGWLARLSSGAPGQPAPASYSDGACFAVQGEKG